MWSVFVLSPSYVYVSTATANADGTHTDWSAPQLLPTVSGKPRDTYMLPHIAPDGTVYTPFINNPQQHQLLNADISLLSSRDCGHFATRATAGPRRTRMRRSTTAEATSLGGTRGSGGTQPVAGTNPVVYPLYLSYEDGSTGRSGVF
jgi:hypothetical protein